MKMNDNLIMFSNSLFSVVTKIEELCNLAKILDLSNKIKIQENLLGAKTSLIQCKVHLELILQQDSKVPEITQNETHINYKHQDPNISIFKEKNNIKNLENSATDNNFENIKDELKNETKEGISIDIESSIDIEAKIKIDEIEELSETEGDYRKESDTNLKQNLKQETKDFNLRNESEDIEEDVKLFLKENTFENGESSFICRICGKTKTNKNQIVNHVNFHKRKSNCNFCDEAVRNFEMKKHKEEKHKSTKVLKQQCRHCYKSFPSEVFSHHFESCRPIKVQCEVCGKVCNGRKNHSDHMRIHMRPYNYTCQICNRKYRTEGELERHNKCSHLDIRTCHICGASIKGENTLKQHMLTHSEDRERAYSCEQCGKSFFVASSLKKHKKTHSDERPFSCDICSKSFKHKEILGNHIRKHNKDDFFKCDDCGKLFSFKSALQKHIRRIHKAVKKYSEINQ